MLELIVIAVALAAVIFLGRVLIAHFSSGNIQRFMNQRRAGSQLVSRGELIDGNRHIPVALALGASALYYESSELQASLDLEWICEVDYDDEVVTGHFIGDGKIVTIRCHSQAFEFLIPMAELAQWQRLLPARRRPIEETAVAPNGDLSRAEDEGWPAPAAAEGTAL